MKKYIPKNKLISLLTCFSFFISTSLLFSQENVRIKRNEFKVSDDDFRPAWKNIRKGNFFFFKNKKGFYQQALFHYLKAAEYNSENAQLNYKIGVCYIMQQSAKSQQYLDNAYNSKNDVAKDIHFQLARAYQLNSQFEKAIEEYTSYKDNLSKGQARKLSALIDQFIKECNNGIELSKKPARVLIDNPGPGINSEFADYAPVFFEQDSIMYFTSRRDNTTGEKRNVLTGDYYEDIYSSHFKEGKWQSAEQLGSPLNTRKNDAAVAISPSGKELMIYKGRKNIGFIYQSTFEDGSWGKPHKITRKIDKKSHRVTSICFSRDSARVYFVSSWKNGYGGKDIWYCTKKKNGNWAKPLNIGSKINTSSDEECVFIGINDSTLYFSSIGHNTIGGYDIFKSTMDQSGVWTDPVNLGTPFNTPADDMFFSISDNGRFGYYSTVREGGLGNKDIYSIVFLGPERKLKLSQDSNLIASFIKPLPDLFVLEQPVNIKTMLMTVVKGKVMDYTTKDPLEGTIDITDNSSNKLYTTVKSDATTGNYQVNLPSGKNYGMAVSATGYMFYSENFNIPADAKYNEVEKDITLLPVNPGSRIVLNNTFFETGKSVLAPESFAELDRLASYFPLYPKLKVEISGHTDSWGTYAFNLNLSKARAQSVVNYLMSKGVSSDKLVAVGYASKYPVADNKTADGRQKNRRVEAKILSN